MNNERHENKFEFESEFEFESQMSPYITKILLGTSGSCDRASLT